MAPHLAGALSAVSPENRNWIFYSVMISLTMAAFLLLPWKARMAQGPGPAAHPRVPAGPRVLTFGPMLVFLMLDMFIPALHEYLERPPAAACWSVVTAVLAPALTLPVTMPYAVLVHRVLDVRLIARRALQYALAR